MTLTSIKTAIAKPGKFLIPLVAASALALAGCAGEGNKQTGGTLGGVWAINADATIRNNTCRANNIITF